MKKAPAPNLPVFLAVDKSDASGVVPVISEEARFVYLRLSSETTLTEDGRSVTLAEVGEGMRLECYGTWDVHAPDHFNVTTARVRGRLDDFETRVRIAEACRRLSQTHPSAPNQVAGLPASAPTGPKVASVSTTSAVVKPTTDGGSSTAPAAKPEEKPVAPAAKPAANP